jgi:hypothetical protein
MTAICLAQGEFDFDPARSKLDLCYDAKLKVINYDLQFGTFPWGKTEAKGRLVGEILNIGFCRSFSEVLKKTAELTENDPELRPMSLAQFLSFFTAHLELCRGKFIGILPAFDIEEESENHLFAYFNGCEKSLQIYGGILDERWSFAFIREKDSLDSAD